MKKLKLTYVTVIVLGQARRTNAHTIDNFGFMGTVSGVTYGFRIVDEGITWARGWHTPAAKALRVVQALA